MRHLRRANCLLGAAMVVSIARQADAQQVSALSVGLTHRSIPADGSSGPGAGGVFVAGTAMSALIALSGARAGQIVDAGICRRRHRGETGFLFSPCFGYAGKPTAVGWLGGAVIGATAGAALVAHRRGCPGRAAVWRALGGAMLGVVPGVAAASSGGEKFPPRRTAALLSAPLLAGIGAASAVVSCRGK